MMCTDLLYNELSESTDEVQYHLHVKMDLYLTDLNKN